MSLLPEVSSKRIFYLDQLRVLAMIGVIFIHVSAQFLSNSDPGTYSFFMSSFFNVFGQSFAVPLFVMISGALLLGRQYKIIDFFKKRLSRIIVPFIFWAILTIILTVSLFNINFSLQYARNIFLGVSGTLGVHFWFIWMLIGLYLFIPIINSFINEYKLKGVEYFLIIWIITIILKTLQILPFYKLELSYFTGYLGFLVLGYYLKNKEIKTNKKILTILTTLGFITMLTISIYPITIGEISLGKSPFTQLISCTTIFILFKTFNEKPNKISKLLKNTIIGKITLSLSTCSYGIYLSHLLILNIIMSIHFNPQAEPLTGILLLTTTTLITSWITTLTLSKIPHIKKLSGT